MHTFTQLEIIAMPLFNILKYFKILTSNMHLALSPLLHHLLFISKKNLQIFMHSTLERQLEFTFKDISVILTFDKVPSLKREMS
jgi:hypothetical protein